MSHFRYACDLQDIPAGGYLACQVDNDSVLLCRVGESVFAIENKCSHMNLPLAGGRLRNCRITCPEHGAVFDVRTGAPLEFPAATALRRFEVRMADGRVEISSEVARRTPPGSGGFFGMLP